MNQLIPALVSLFLMFSAQAAPETKAGAPIYLEMGEQKILSFPQILRYSVSGNCIHYVRSKESPQILVKALKPGLATLYVASSETENETHLIRVEQRPTAPYPPAFLKALNTLKSTEALDAGDHFILRGPVSDLSERKAVANLRERFPALITDETLLDARLYERSKIELTKLVRTHPALSLITDEGSLLIRGAVGSVAVREALLKQIMAIEPLARVELQTIKDADPTLYFKIFLLEVKKELILNLGVDWPPTHPASVNLSTPQFLMSDSLELTIHTLTEQGLVKVLSSPELVVKAPGQAELFAGRELPIKQRSKYNDNILWKNIGLALKLDVKEYSGEKVRLTVETEMSHLDPALDNDNIPGVRTNRIKTLVDGVINKPLLLSGLLQEDLRQHTRGIPALSMIPVIGRLFSSEDYQNSRSEFVAILLPHREAPANPLKRISSETPKGFLPLPRNHLNAEEKLNSKRSPHYPWSVL